MHLPACRLGPRNRDRKPVGFVAIRSPTQAQQISELINELETEGQLEDIKLTGTQWRLVYTSSTASSSGKIGPFIGRVFKVRYVVVGYP